MAPFMILGRKVRNLFRWPALRLKAELDKCINCKKCTANCPMSLDVNGMVQGGTRMRGIGGSGSRREGDGADCGCGRAHIAG